MFTKGQNDVYTFKGFSFPVKKDGIYRVPWMLDEGQSNQNRLIPGVSPSQSSESQPESPPARFRSFLNKPSHFSYPVNKKGAYYKKAGAGGIIVDANTGRLLIVKGTAKWSLPKGHLDKGEKYHECAMREIREETNLDVELSINDRYFDVKKYIYYVINLRDADRFELRTNDPEEIQEVKWASLEEILGLNCNRQLEYVITRWDFIHSIINNYREKVTKYPISATASTDTEESDQEEEKTDGKPGTEYPVVS